MTDFLLELRSEEIPARMQDKARDDLARLFAAELAKAGLHPAATVTFATPRRLALIVRGLPKATEAVRDEVKGPKTAAPPQALEGFLRKTGLTRDQLTTRDGVFFAVTEKSGRATAAVLAEAIPAVIRTFPWPKSMRWGAASASTESLRWVRPLHGIVALLGEEIVPVEIAGIASGATTYGHRFHHPGPITIGSAADYEEKLRACHVIVDQDQRRKLIRDRATALAAEAGLELIEDEGLVTENAGLTEWPVPLLGRFDPDFLSVPPEVIQLTARVNQKYFVCRDGEGKLANAFVCTANIDATDGGTRIVEGNRKVLAARLSDARFFYDTDLKVPLEEQAKKLDRIVFHEKLGTVADKVDRVAKLARWLVEEGIVTSQSSPSSLGEGDHAQHGGGARSEAEGGAGPSTTGYAGAEGRIVSQTILERAGHVQPAAPPPQDKLGEDLADLAERAARLAKADLVTGMVGEFPELQGLMGGYYAAAQREHPAVAAAIRDHYKPVGQGDDVPTAPVTVAVSLADKLDTLLRFFGVAERPSGSRDPFALRRSALGALQLLLHNGLRLDLGKLVRWCSAELEARYHDQDETTEHMAVRGALSGPWSSKERYHYAHPIILRDVDGPLFRDGDNDDYDWDFYLRRDAELDALKQEDSWTISATEILRRLVSASLHWSRLTPALLDFFADRLKVQQREAGVRHDLIDAVFALGGEDDLVRLLARVRALQGFVGTEDGANLLAGYKRAANILKKEGYTQPAPLPGREGLGVGVEPQGSTDDARAERDPAGRAPTPDPSLAGRGEKGLSYTPETAEAALIAALDSAEPRARAAVDAEDFEGAMAALASLRAPIDAFFETVTVNDPDPAKREARLALLARVRAAVHAVADFSRIEG